MNDRYKFRVWDKKQKKYLNPYNYLIALTHNVELYTINCGGTHTKLNKDYYIIEQCTGLKDKNRDLIFDGDVLQHPISKETFVVQWKWNQFRAVYNNELCSPLHLQVNEKGLASIIGNIHDTKTTLDEVKG